LTVPSVVNGHFKLFKGGRVHQLDVSAVPLRVAHFIGHNVRTTLTEQTDSPTSAIVAHTASVSSLLPVSATSTLAWNCGTATCSLNGASG
jgi:hypothetical protein